MKYVNFILSRRPDLIIVLCSQICNDTICNIKQVTRYYFINLVTAKITSKFQIIVKRTSLYRTFPVITIHSYNIASVPT